MVVKEAKPDSHCTPKKGEPYMNHEQLEYFSKVLLDWKEGIINGSQKTKEYLRNEQGQTADLNDRASQEEEFSLELRTRDRERKLLKKIDQALVRIKNGDFGYCEHCDEEIGLGRLKARPTAELCIDCKQLSEVKEKGFLDVR